MKKSQKVKKQKSKLSKIPGKIKRVVLGVSTAVWSRVSLRGLPKQEDFVHKGDWDTLIILDTCRFDYFKENYPTYLKGDLKAVKSPGSWTYDWLTKMFKDKYDITVYSSHPVLNSRGIERSGYVAKPHFKRIVDVWDSGWDDDLGSVPPQAINKAVLFDIKIGKFKGKNIIWYMQPHAPWIGKTRLTGNSKGWNDKEHLGKIWDAVRKGEIPKEDLEKAYRDNLKLVLENVAEIIPRLKGKTIVSSDHGELLGEYGMFGHAHYMVVKKLREVPWLEVKS